MRDGVGVTPNVIDLPVGETFSFVAQKFSTTRNRVVVRDLASIGKQDRLESTLNRAMVLPMLSQHANNEWQRVAKRRIGFPDASD